MTGDGTYRVELAYAPDHADDARPFRAYIFEVGDDGDTLREAVWGKTRDSALLHAREWVKAHNTHGDPETVLLDRNGDLISQPPKIPDASGVPHVYWDGTKHSVKVPE